MESCLAASCAAAAQGSPLIFAQLVRTLLAAQCTLGNSEDYPVDRTAEILESKTVFDFVIVGGGSAGSVLASRLTEKSNWNVLLVEAGKDPSLLSDVPAFITLLQGTEENYRYKVEHQDCCCQSTSEKICLWNKGKALGGSSVINAMLYVLGNDRDFNEWAEAGNEGWSYEDVLPYFRKTMDCPRDYVAKEGDRRCGIGGPLKIRSYNFSESSVQEIMLEAARQVGLPVYDYIHGENYIGYGKALGTIDQGRRVSVSKAYLSPVKERKNLYVMKSARVDKIHFDGNRATGVRITSKDGKTIDVEASKEVILSAGSIASPQILMLSGIGPEEHLKEMGIPLLANLPVGKNLQDHLMWFGPHVTFPNDSLATPPPMSQPLDTAYNYLIHGKGDFATVGGLDLLGFVNVNEPNSKYPDIQLMMAHIPRWEVPKIQFTIKAFDLLDELVDQMGKVIMESDVVFIWPVLLKPKSVGEVKLRSTDPADPVKIYANYFTDPEDKETVLKSLDFIKSLTKTKAMKDNKWQLRTYDIPDCRDTKPDTMEYWECNLRHLTSTIYHAVGTAKMGPSGDSSAVVDPWLKVHGIQRLRVIDASIMPKITSGNTNAPTIMIAERGADLIKEEWLRKDEF